MVRRVLCALGLVLLPLNAFGQGPLLWEVQEDFHGVGATVGSMTLSGKAALIAASADDGAGGRDVVIQALRRSTGAVQWSDQHPGPNALIVSRQQTAFVAAPESADDPILLRAYDVPSGTLLWEASTPLSFPGARPHLTDLAVGATAVVVVGYEAPALQMTMPTPLMGVATAYDRQTGTLLWQKQIAAEGLHAIAAAVVLNGNRVFVAAYYRSAATYWPSAAMSYEATDSDTLSIGAYDVRSGELAWVDHRPSTLATKLALVSGQLVFAGSQYTTAGGPVTYLAAVSPRTGTTLWEGNAPSPGHFIDLAVKGLRVVGVTTNQGAPGVVQVYHGDTGALAWEDLQGRTDLYALAVDLSKDDVYIGGYFLGSSANGRSYTEILVRAYDGETGALLWDDRSHGSSSGFPNAAAAVVAGPNRLFIAGYAGPDVPPRIGTPPPPLDVIVRAYDIRSDRTDP
jgi:hypothetical protein